MQMLNPQGKGLVPEPPQLRALELRMSETPISANSLPSTRSGANRMHPYGPDGEVSTDTSYEVVSSVATQAPVAFGTDTSMEATPVAT